MRGGEGGNGEANLFKNLLKAINVERECTLYDTLFAASRMKYILERSSYTRDGKDIKCAYRGLPLFVCARARARTHTHV